MDIQLFKYHLLKSLPFPLYIVLATVSKTKWLYKCEFIYRSALFFFKSIYSFPFLLSKPISLPKREMPWKVFKV